MSGIRSFARSGDKNTMQMDSRSRGLTASRVRGRSPGKSFLATAAWCVVLACGGRVRAQDRMQHVVGGANNEIRLINGYPEYWVDGRPFLMHAAAFFYHRLPRDRWAEELERLKAMGVNTIDVYPFWNWHEPEENVYDFDGHTNPRRDLKYLLRLTEELGFKVTLRPGPYFTAEWRNGGYPDWLLRRPEYKMSEQAILESRYPRLSALQYDRSDEAAAGYLGNPTHLGYAKQWYQQVLGVAEPYLAEHGGNILNIQIDDDQAIGPENYNGPNFWKYMDTLRGFAKDAIHHSDVPYYINGADMRLNAEANDLTVEPFWNMGQDYQMSGPGGYSSVREAAKNKFTTDNLKLQPLFPPAIIEYGPGWRLNEKDTYETPSHDPSNLLLESRVFLQNGLKGLNYYSLNDTVYPAGYEAPWANYFYAREGAVDYTGAERSSAPYARRNGRLVSGVGSLLGATHFVADAALVYSMGSFPQAELSAEEANFIAESAQRIAWSGAFAHYNFELIDSDHTPEQNFQRYQLLLLFDPAAGELETGKSFPHLHRWSVKAQQVIQRYLEAGGTVLLFPSVPRGEIFDPLFRNLGATRTIPGDAEIRFAGGARGQLAGYRTVVATATASEADIFARDAQGQPVGVRFKIGKGRVVFLGGDFSLWSGLQDPALWPALMGEAGVSRKVNADTVDGDTVDANTKTGSNQKAPLYATELIADTASPPGTGGVANQPGYGFVGVTNFSPDESSTARLRVSDPRASAVDSVAGERSIQLPEITLPPRESLLLPVRIPLNRILAGRGVPLESSDEIYYATEELTGVAYDATTLSLEFTAPLDGEVALRLSRHPRSAEVDGQTAPTREADGLFVIAIPKAKAPNFERRVEITYPRQVPSIHFLNGHTWLRDAKNNAIVRIDNPGASPLEGDLEFSAGTLQASQHAPVSVPEHGSSQIIFRVGIAADIAEGMVANLTATLHGAGREDVSAGSEVTVHAPWTATVQTSWAATFPLREDQVVPIIHPLLASVNLPEVPKFQVRVKNWSDQAREATLTISGSDLEITSSSGKLELPAGSEKIVEFKANPLKGTGLYHFFVRIDGAGLHAEEDVAVAAIAHGEALAYRFDYDRDGFDDVILENQQLRCFVSPHAGGRSFALMRKDTNDNAFDSVGGMRDSFTTRFEPPDMHGLPDWTTEKWLGLYNRPYSFEITAPAGPEARVELEYEAPDIYPAGIHLKRTLSLAGNQEMLVESTSITPHRIKKLQAFVLESSVPFRASLPSGYNQWFAEGRPALDFEPGKKIDVENHPRFIGTRNRNNGETLAMILLTKPRALQIVPEAHSALFRFIYANFARANQTYTYTVGYSLGKDVPAAP
jgi:Glycosyl hydrolases family 35